MSQRSLGHHEVPKLSKAGDVGDKVGTKLTNLAECAETECA